MGVSHCHFLSKSPEISHIVSCLFFHSSYSNVCLFPATRPGHFYLNEIYLNVSFDGGDVGKDFSADVTGPSFLGGVNFQLVTSEKRNGQSLFFPSVNYECNPVLIIHS